MKNCQIVPTRPAFRVPVRGLPPLQGWAVRLLSGIDDEGTKPGFWMSSWHVGSQDIDFAFEEKLYMVFNEESQARKGAEFLRDNAEIETEVVKIGDAP